MVIPKISIILPCYGVEKYLDRCMESIVNQTLKDIEIILVDDGSPDHVPVMCDEWADRDARIKVVHKKNAGLGYARNSGLDVASGEYVAFVDSDDFVDTGMYESLYHHAVKYQADCVFCGFKTENNNGEWLDTCEVKELTVFDGEQVRAFMLDMIACAPGVSAERKYQMSVWHAIYKSEIVKSNEIRFVSERIFASEDLPFQVDFLSQARRVVYVNECYYHYCYNQFSLTTTFKIEKYERYKKLHQLIGSKFEENSEEQKRVDRLLIGYVRSFLWNMCYSGRMTDSNLKLLTNDDIWKVLSQRYPAKYLPLYPRVIYELICSRRHLLLKIAYQMIIRIRHR